MNWLIVFATNQDQSAKVAQRIARDLSSFGDEVDLYSAAALPMALGVAGYDAVIVGASAHAGPCRRAVRQFIDEHLVELGRMPSAFYSISLSEECSDPTNRPRSQAACDTLLEETGWQPDLVAVFAGPNPRARASSRLVQRVVRRGRQPDDVVSENAGYQYFDWHPVTTFARDCAMSAHHVHLTGAAGPACSAPR